MDSGLDNRIFGDRIFSLYDLMIHLNLDHFKYQMEFADGRIQSVSNHWDELCEPDACLMVWDAFVDLANECRGEGEEETDENRTKPYLPETKKRALEIGNKYRTLLDAVAADSKMKRDDPQFWERMLSTGWTETPAPQATGQQFYWWWEHLKAGFDMDLKSVQLFQLEQEDARRYDNPQPFGAVASNLGKDVEWDSTEAVKCLAFGRYTASVFHCMRVVERVVQLVASDYGIQPKDDGKPVRIEDTTWDKLLTLITNELGKHTKSGQSEKDTRMREIAVSLDSIRGIWRNPVAHPHHRYAELPARSIFNYTREVAQQVAVLLSNGTLKQTP